MFHSKSEVRNSQLGGRNYYLSVFQMSSLEKWKMDMDSGKGLMFVCVWFLIKDKMYKQIV